MLSSFWGFPHKHPPLSASFWEISLYWTRRIPVFWIAVSFPPQACAMHFLEEQRRGSRQSAFWHFRKINGTCQQSCLRLAAEITESSNQPHELQSAPSPWLKCKALLFSHVALLITWALLYRPVAHRVIRQILFIIISNVMNPYDHFTEMQLFFLPFVLSA